MDREGEPQEAPPGGVSAGDGGDRGILGHEGRPLNAPTLLLFLLGLALLVIGAEVLVRGASRLAAAVGISPLVIGLTVVAYGTSSPEMAVSVKSALAGQTDIALGNVVGSNIFNVLFILGISAAVTPLIVSARLVLLDVPIMIGVSALLMVLGFDGSLGRLDGGLLLAGMAAYTIFAATQSRRETREIQEEYAHEFAARPSDAGRWPVQVALVLIGLGLLILGSRWLVDGATAIARTLGISELIIGLTIVAAGTSLPEVATSLIAALRGERDIAVGNVVGSNIFNILAVLGASALLAPEGVGVSAAALRFDIPVMIAVAVASLPIFFTGHLIARWEGALFLAYYAAYVLYLILDAVEHDALPQLSGVMLLFVLPLTAVTLAIGAVRYARSRGPGLPS